VTEVTVARPVEGPRSGSLEARTSVGLKALAIINLIGVLLAVFPPPYPVSLLLTVTFNLAAAGLAGLELLFARALDLRRPWAVAAVRAVLVLLIASGAYTVYAGIMAGIVRIPFEGIIAAWALLAPPDPGLERRRDRRSVGMVLALAAVLSALHFGRFVVDWGGAMDVRPVHLSATLDVDCGGGSGGSAALGEPQTIRVAYRWSWSWSTPLANGLDVAIIGWDGEDAAGRPLYVLGDSPDGSPGVRSGGQDVPSADMASAVEAQTRSSWDWSIDLSRQRYAPGTIEMTLQRSPVADHGPGTLRLRASYVHLGLWHEETAPITCAW
jgi:hypothetical protein